MTTTITYDGGPAITPRLALIGSHERERQSRTVTHEILGGPPVFTLRPASTSTGTLMLLFTNEQDAADAYDAHELAAVFTITDTTRGALNFTYVVDGAIRSRLDPDTADTWRVEVQYRETT